MDALLRSQAPRLSQPHDSSAGQKGHSSTSESSREGIKGKVRVPRLNGGRVGVLATRTPHRPCPLGLSVARVERVDASQLWVSGADLVDGTPILDVKPYLPFCDSWPAAICPSWVDAKDDEEPLRVSSVEMGGEAGAQLHAAWAARNIALHRSGQLPLFPDYEAFCRVVKEVLSLDIRSAHQRLRQPPLKGQAVPQVDPQRVHPAAAGMELVSASELSGSRRDPCWSEPWPAADACSEMGRAPLGTSPELDPAARPCLPDAAARLFAEHMGELPETPTMFCEGCLVSPSESRMPEQHGLQPAGPPESDAHGPDLLHLPGHGSQDDMAQSATQNACCAGRATLGAADMAADASANSGPRAHAGTGMAPARYNVVLQGIQVWYDIDSSKRVIIESAGLWERSV
ncbi:hypothetical protein WJX84_003490 [Apatococcus fuscideae]|uniref:TsaA-like domain-containing protein n=1 Tax=Apatococcus fuscideae TaxID=2026836 RepID=A0AAW1SXB2_9CHLO